MADRDDDQITLGELQQQLPQWIKQYGEDAVLYGFDDGLHLAINKAKVPGHSTPACYFKAQLHFFNGWS